MWLISVPRNVNMRAHVNRASVTAKMATLVASVRFVIDVNDLDLSFLLILGLISMQLKYSRLQRRRNLKLFIWMTMASVTRPTSAAAMWLSTDMTSSTLKGWNVVSILCSISVVAMGVQCARLVCAHLSDQMIVFGIIVRKNVWEVFWLSSAVPDWNFCFLQQYNLTVNKGSYEDIKGIYLNFNAVLCELKEVRSCSISVSNDGINFATGKLFLPYNSNCQMCHVANQTCISSIEQANCFIFIYVLNIWVALKACLHEYRF